MTQIIPSQMSTWIISLLLPYIVYATSSTGSYCTHSLQCGKGMYCGENVCRKSDCVLNSQCQKGERCHYGKVDGKTKTACFSSDLQPANRPAPSGETDKYCPGGGAVVIGADGKLASCDLVQACSGTNICNPQYGLCCTKLRTCPRPAKTMLNVVSGKPIMCQVKNGRQMPCPGNGYCELKTGFCCMEEQEVKGIEKPDIRPDPVINTRPWRGQQCNPLTGCDGNAACMCASKGACRCECPTEFGYTVAGDGKTCQRVRRRLKEKCKTDMECSAAFSECATGGCRCKKGFQRDGDGGCKPITYKCVNNETPLMKNDKQVTCSLRHRNVLSFSSRKDNNITTVELDTTTTVSITSITNLTQSDDWRTNDRDNCPEDHYCVPVFDDSSRPGYYQGFCCPTPTETKPVCPVGDAHESSYYPEYGCRECPGDYFCHKDTVATDKEICCPKPCVSLEDIYHDGQCFGLAYFGDSCHVTAQCVFTKAPQPADEYSESTRLECSKGVCTCPAGFNFADGECKRIMCTIGLRGEPSVDRLGSLVRCDRSSDCSQGHMCDPNTHVCCKGNNRCPKEYVETGELCNNDNCRGPNDLCHRTKDGKVKVCCSLDDVTKVL